jgi:hypothetical protein
MAKETVPDYSGIEIKKLPPGRAYGASDLAKWAHNRAVGRSGVDDAKSVDKRWFCKHCKTANIVCINPNALSLPDRACRGCGVWNTKIRLCRMRRWKRR